MSERIPCIRGGGGWSDASVDHVVLTGESVVSDLRAKEEEERIIAALEERFWGDGWFVTEDAM